jgi:hypothetical protein
MVAIEWLKVASQKAVADQLSLSWDEVHSIQERAVRRGLAQREAEAVEHIGVDEKSFTRGHCYFTLVNDLDPTILGSQDCCHAVARVRPLVGRLKCETTRGHLAKEMFRIPPRVIFQLNPANPAQCVRTGRRECSVFRTLDVEFQKVNGFAD